MTIKIKIYWNNGEFNLEQITINELFRRIKK